MRVASAAALARLLAERLAAGGDAGRAVTVSDLLERILPYPLVRERLALAGKGEYDVAILRLLSDRTLLQLDPALHDAAAKELERPEPGLRALGKLSDSLLRLRAAPAPETRRSEPEDADEAAPPTESAAPDAGDPAPAPDAGHPVRAPDPGAAAPSPEPRESAPEPARVAPETARPAAPGAPHPADSATACWSCGAGLPARAGLRYCPHCGMDQQAPRCTSCGDRLEPGWAYCPRCGRALGRT